MYSASVYWVISTNWLFLFLGLYGIQDRVTDHRLGKSGMSWGDVMERNGLEDLIEGLQERHRKEVVEEVLAEWEEAEKGRAK